MGRLVYLKDVVSLALDPDKCFGCGRCLEVCPRAVLGLNGRRVLIRDRDACMECGACARNCPTEALTVKAGVGCAAAVINTALGRTNSACCSLDPAADGGGRGACTC